MDIYKIEWDIFDNFFLEGLDKGFNEDYNWYMINSMDREEEILYIGMAYKQSVSDRLLSNHAAFKQIIKEVDEKIYLAFGRFINEKNITEEKIRDIEAAMIDNFKPKYNASGIRGYKGKPIKIISKQSSRRFKKYEEFDWEIEF